MHAAVFCCRDHELGPTTLKLDREIDIRKTYLQNEKPFESYSLNKYENSSQDQRSRSNVTNFQTLLAFTVVHISTESRQFLISSFRDFV